VRGGHSLLALGHWLLALGRRGDERVSPAGIIARLNDGIGANLCCAAK